MRDILTFLIEENVGRNNIRNNLKLTVGGYYLVSNKSQNKYSCNRIPLSRLILEKLRYIVLLPEKMYLLA